MPIKTLTIGTLLDGLSQFPRDAALVFNVKTPEGHVCTGSTEPDVSAVATIKMIQVEDDLIVLYLVTKKVIGYIS